MSAPNVRALLTFQDHLLRGIWAERHLEALANNTDTVGPLLQLTECSVTLQQAQQRRLPPAKQRVLQTRNMICVCHATCPEETVAWVQCMRGMAKATKIAAQNGTPVPANGACDRQRHVLELCTQRATSRLLHAAVLPTDREDVGL